MYIKCQIDVKCYVNYITIHTGIQGCRLSCLLTALYFNHFVHIVFVQLSISIKLIDIILH